MSNGSNGVHINAHLQPNKKQPEGTPNLLIIVVSTATGTVVIGECMHIILLCTCGKHLIGSY